MQVSSQHLINKTSTEVVISKANDIILLTITAGTGKFGEGTMDRMCTNVSQKQTRTTILVSNGRYTFYQIHFIKHNLSNTIHQYLLSNTIYQIPSIKYHLQSQKNLMNESIN